MNCSDPFVRGTVAHPCGKCEPCLVQRRRTWMHRIMLEAAQYKDNAFFTLTYEDGKLPLTKDDIPTLAPEHLRDFWKRLRHKMSPQKFRYYACGEYGDETYRPHYHAVVFGFPNCLRGQSVYTRWRPTECCTVCDTVREAWGFGNIYIGAVTTATAQYVAGYVLKKMTRFDDPRLNGRHPEFSRQSNNGGIGLAAMDEVASVLMSLNLDLTKTDVPVSLRHGKKILPLGRYLRGKLRERVGMDKKALPNEELQKEMHRVLLASIENETSLAKEIVAQNAGSRASITSRARLHKQGKKL